MKKTKANDDKSDKRIPDAEYAFDPDKKPSLKGRNVEDYRRIINVLYEQIERKDIQIDKLKEYNAVLIRTAFKAEENLKEFKERIKEEQKKD
ncbi:MAG: hypothetical protein KKF44_02950 [Nanoarchaeota archaeon]|nr:hypothetical protein [Nanoarchaeota archaeon]